LACPHCGKSVNLRVVKVVDEPAVAAEVHYVAEVVAPGTGGLFDATKGSEGDES